VGTASSVCRRAPSAMPVECPKQCRRARWRPRPRFPPPLRGRLRRRPPTAHAIPTPKPSTAATSGSSRLRGLCGRAWRERFSWARLTALSVPHVASLQTRVSGSVPIVCRPVSIAESSMDRLLVTPAKQRAGISGVTDYLHATPCSLSRWLFGLREERHGPRSPKRSSRTSRAREARQTNGRGLV